MLWMSPAEEFATTVKFGCEEKQNGAVRKGQRWRERRKEEKQVESNLTGFRGGGSLSDGGI